MSKTNPRSKKVCYYATNVPNKFIEITVHYTKGVNYFNGESYDGYKLGMTPLTMKVDNGWCSTSFAVFDGLALKVEPAPRFNAKRMAKIAELAHTLPDYEACLASVAAKHGLTVGAKLTEKEAWALAATASEAS